MKKTVLTISAIILTVVIVASVIIGKNDKTEIVIKEEQITYQKIVSKDDNNSDEEIINQLFKEEVISKECKKRKIKLDNKLIAELKEKAEGELSEETLNKIKSNGMTEEKFREILFNRLVSAHEDSILKDQLTEEIANNNVQVNDKNFKKKVDNFNKTKNIKNAAEFQDLVLRSYNLLEEYIEILEKDYVKVID